MLYKARVEVSLKPGHSDPEGETTARSLRELAYSVRNVGVSKMYTITIEADSKKKAEEHVEEMCRRLLANPTKDNYTFKVEENR
ncbi:MAG TPA: phosphoribosylformylglycinamidine synthase subunit PurS [Candidatus Paceibacterota bacterium]|nr:phosphoribosylformylglycinamidine synthase subunit PurS [Candidatus Paceibacterota bacterium]